MVKNKWFVRILHILEIQFFSVCQKLNFEGTPLQFFVIRKDGGDFSEESDGGQAP